MLVLNERQERHLTGTLDRGRQLTLMLCTGAGDAAGEDLRSFGNILSQTKSIFIIDNLGFFCAESANLLFPMHRVEGARCVISFHGYNTFLTH